MTQKGVIILVVVLAIVLLGGYLLFSSPSTTEPVAMTPPPAVVGEVPPPGGTVTPPPPVAQGTTHTVAYTATGYSPASLTIKQGDAVTWVNQSGKEMWPASAVHPTHNVYPTTGGCLGSTFDACARLAAGTSWSFTFDHKGIWRYHDHIDASKFGSITVE